MFGFVGKKFVVAMAFFSCSALTCFSFFFNFSSLVISLQDKDLQKAYCLIIKP